VIPWNPENVFRRRDPRLGQLVKITPHAGAHADVVAVKGAHGTIVTVSVATQSFDVSLVDRIRASGSDRVVVRFDDCDFVDRRFTVPSNPSLAPSRTLSREPSPPTPLAGGSTPAWTSEPDVASVSGPWVPDIHDEVAAMGKQIVISVTGLTHFR
jgi:hypothetical protein